MKIVREHLNEIRQNREESGLGALGVGHAAVCPAFDVIKTSYPEVLSKLNKLNAPTSSKDYQLINAIISAAKDFNTSKDNIAIISSTDIKSNAVKEILRKLVNDESTVISPKTSYNIKTTITTSVKNGIAEESKINSLPSGMVLHTRTYIIKVPPNF